MFLPLYVQCVLLLCYMLSVYRHVIVVVEHSILGTLFE